jgi:hypothetical protein
MNVLREVFYRIEKKSYDKAAAHLRGYGRRRHASLAIEWWRHKQSPGPDDDSAFVSLQGFLIDRSHFRITRNDVARSIVGRQLNQNAPVLGHCQTHYGFVLCDINLRFADKEIR